MFIPACLGRARQLLWPCWWIKETKIWSSSGVHGPLFNPIFSQHGALPIFLWYVLITDEKFVLWYDRDRLCWSNAYELYDQMLLMSMRRTGWFWVFILNLLKGMWENSKAFRQLPGRRWERERERGRDVFWLLAP